MYHPIIICEEIANRLRDPQALLQLIEDKQSRGELAEGVWIPETLFAGFPGIACFFATMDSLFPNDGWEDASHAYLSLCVNYIEKSSDRGSGLFSGLTGFCFAILLCSHRGGRYSNILNKLEKVLQQEIETLYLSPLQKHLLEKTLPPASLYNLSDGLSGVLAYIYLRKENMQLYDFATTCLRILIQLMDRMVWYRDEKVPGWFIPSESHIVPSEAEKYSEGSYLLNLPFGVLGCLSVLAQGALEGYRVDQLYEVIENLANWVQDQQTEIEKLPYWANTIPHKKANVTENIQTLNELNRDIWWSGIPAVCRSLYLAGKALKNNTLKQTAEQTFLKMFQKPTKDWNHMGPSFSVGRAGILVVTYRMAEDTHNPAIWKQMDLLKEDLLTFYHPHSAFGFQAVDVTNKGEYRWIDNPGLMNGAVGVALSLLLTERREDMLWDQAFLTR